MHPFRTLIKSVTNTYGAMTNVVGGMFSRINGWGWSRVRMFAPGSRFDWEREAGAIWGNSIVGLAISWLGDRFSRPLIRVSKLSRQGDYRPVGRHPLTDLWGRPNPHYSRRTLEKAVGLSLKCDGNAYLYKVRDRMGRVVELWWVYHGRIGPTWPLDGSVYIDGYRIVLDTVSYWVPARDIIHVRDGIDPLNERLGIAALKSNLREVCTVNSESSYTAALLKNSGVPSLAIVPDGDGPVRASADAAATIKETFRDKFAGDNAGDPIVMAGKYRIEQVGFSPEQLKLDRLPQAAVSRIAGSIGVAAMSMGLPDPGKTYANLAEANRTSWGTIVAIQELVGESLRWELLPEFGCDPMAYAIEYDYSHIQELQESLDSLHGRTREDFKAGGITQNEWREQIGFEPAPDGDRWMPGTGDPGEVPATPDAGPADAVADDDAKGGRQGADAPRSPLALKSQARDADGRFASTGGRARLKDADVEAAKVHIAAAKAKGADIALGSGRAANPREAKAGGVAARKGMHAVATTGTPKVDTTRRGELVTHRFKDPNVGRTRPDSELDPIVARTYPDPDRKGRWVSSRKTEGSEPDKSSHATRGQALRKSKAHMEEAASEFAERDVKVVKSIARHVKAETEYAGTAAAGKWKVRIKVID